MDSLRIETDKESVSTFQQVSVLLINLAISPPEYGLVENLSPTLDEVEAYIAIPGHNLFRGIVGGGIILVLLFFGLAVAIRSSFRVHTPHKRDLIILLLATLSMVGGLLVAVQIYWIRYTIPAIPFVCIWIAYGLASIFEKQSPG
jgi:Ca2+/Na+ antiporter